MKIVLWLTSQILLAIGLATLIAHAQHEIPIENKIVLWWFLGVGYYLNFFTSGKAVLGGK